MQNLQMDQRLCRHSVNRKLSCHVLPLRWLLTVYLHLTNSPISISYILITLLSISSNKPISSYLWGWWHNLRTTLRNWCMLGTQKSKFVQWSLRWTVCIGLNTFDLTEWTSLLYSTHSSRTRFTSFYIFLPCSHDEQHVSTGPQGTGHEDLQVENGSRAQEMEGWRSAGCGGSKQDTETQQWT